MYALPAQADPHYQAADHAPAAARSDDVEITSIVAEQHQHVRALPVARGTALAWSHRLIHWGSAHGGAPADRKTLAFALADPSFEPPLLRVPPASDADEARANARASASGVGVLPPLRARLAIIAHLLIRYHHEASHPAPLWPSTLLHALTLLLECATVRAP
jgi:hypothetical protein